MMPLAAAAAGLIVGFGLALFVITRQLNTRHLKVGDAIQGSRNTDLSSDRHLVMVVLGSATCGASRGTQLASSIRAVGDSLRAIAGRHGVLFASIGIAIDNDPDRGVVWLRDVGNFDEVAAGPGILNSALAEYVWHQPKSLEATPQIVVTWRVTGRHAHAEPRVVSNEVLLRMIGRDDILSVGRVRDVDSLLTIRGETPVRPPLPGAAR